MGKEDYWLHNIYPKELKAEMGNKFLEAIMDSGIITGRPALKGQLRWF